MLNIADAGKISSAASTSLIRVIDQTFTTFNGGNDRHGIVELISHIHLCI
jgi:hypothetical protein